MCIKEKNYTGKQLIQQLIKENKEDCEMMLNWLKQSGEKALENHEFYEIYRAVKECYEESLDRDSYLYNILVRVNYDLSQL